MSKERSRGGAKRAARARQRQGRRNLVIASVLAVSVVAGFIWIGNSTNTDQGQAASAVPESSRVRGVATAVVTIEEYADFQCPACGQFARTTGAQLLRTYIAEGKVKLVFRHFAFLGAESNWAAEATECAAEQGKFWDMHDKLYASQAGENRGAFSKSNLKRMGDALGLGPSFAACVDSGRYAQAIRDLSDDASERGVRATPTLYIDGRKIEGAATFEQLKTIIDAALAR
jgi:protein-disulfide isomerase